MLIRCLFRLFLPALLALFVLAGCGTPRTTQPTAPIAERPAPSLQAPIEPTRTPNPPATQTATVSLPTPTTIVTIQPHADEQTAMPAPDPVVLVRDQDGVRLEASSGQLANPEWLDE